MTYKSYKKKKNPYKSVGKIIHKRKRTKKADPFVMVNRMPTSSKLVFPPRFLTKQTLTTMLYTTIANGNKQNAFFICAAPYHPYSPAGTSLTYVFSGQNTGGLSQLLGSGTETLTTENMAGYLDITNVYSSYRVHSSKIRVTASPGALGDTSVLTVVPVPYGTFTGILTVPSYFDIPFVNDLQYSKNKIISSNNVQSNNTISMRHHHRDIVGMTKAQWSAQAPTAFNAQPSSQYLVDYLIVASTTDNAALNGVMQFEVELEISVEWFNEFYSF